MKEIIKIRAEINEIETKKTIEKIGTSLAVRWLKLHAPNSGGPGSIPGWGTRSHMLQLKIPHSATKTWHSQINK